MDEGAPTLASTLSKATLIEAAAANGGLARLGERGAALDWIRGARRHRPAPGPRMHASLAHGGCLASLQGRAQGPDGTLLSRPLVWTRVRPHLQARSARLHSSRLLIPSYPGPGYPKISGDKVYGISHKPGTTFWAQVIPGIPRPIRTWPMTGPLGIRGYPSG